jgi:hypothetical protein
MRPRKRSVPPKNRGVFLVLAFLIHALAGGTFPAARWGERPPLARCSPPTTLNTLGPACCAGHHPSCLFTVAHPTCVCCQCVSCSGLSQAVMGSFSFRFHALAVALTYPRPLGRSQRLKQRPTLLLFTTTTPTLVHSHLLQTPVPAYSTCCQHLPLWHHPLCCSCLR